MYKIRLDGKYLYHPWDDSRCITDGKLTQEISKNGTCDVSIPFTHPLADSVLRRKSILEVVRFDMQNKEKVVYRGVCMNGAENAGLELELQTDGDLVFLQDSVIRPYTSVEEDGPGTVDPAGYFRWMIAKHNAQIDDFKQFVVGTVNVTGETKLRTREAYNTTREAVDDLVAEYGGYVRTRTEGGVHYIDYLAEYGAKSSQDIRQGKNVVDITKYIKTDDLATRIVPIGATTNNGRALTIESVNNGLDYIQDETAVAEFGIITKIVEFSGISSPDKLLSAGKDYMGTVKGANMTVELTAVDLADAGIDTDSIEVGDMVSCVVPSYNINMTLQVTKKVTYILKPENSRITLGNSLLTYTQQQLNSNRSVLPMVQKAVNSAAKANETAQSVQSQVDEILSNPVEDITGNAGTATKLKTERAIEGVTFDGSAARHHYTTCSTSGSTAAKTCSLTGFSLVTGARVIVRFSYANTAEKPTLNVSGTGAKDIRYRGSAIPVGYIQQYTVLELEYSGTYWYVVGDLTQKQIDDLKAEFADKVFEPAQIWDGSTSPLYCSAIGSWAYTDAISDLANWNEIRVWVEIGDASRGYHTITRDNPLIHVSGFTNASYYGCVQVKWDTANNKIGLYVAQKASNWGYSTLNVKRIDGMRKL